MIKNISCQVTFTLFSLRKQITPIIGNIVFGDISPIQNRVGYFPRNFLEPKRNHWKYAYKNMWTAYMCRGDMKQIIGKENNFLAVD